MFANSTNYVKRFIWVIAFLFIIFIAILCYGIFTSEVALKKLQVYFFDVGQGDSIYIKTPSGRDILIDGGADGSILYELGRNMSWYDLNIDSVILTHPHRDHLAGLLDVFEKYKVDTIYYTGVGYESGLYEKWRLQALVEGDLVKITDKQKIDLGDDVSLEFLFPMQGFDLNEDGLDVNNTSIVTRVVYGQNEFLLMGDAEREVEAFLLDSDVVMESDIIKLGHHGSDSSSTEAFLRAVNPNIAIISSGKNNSYGHPHARVLDRLSRFGIDIRRTDTEGTVCLEGDGVRINNCSNKFDGLLAVVVGLFR